MSSVVAFARAFIMLACLVAVPVLAVTHESAFLRTRQAAVRLWNRLSGDSDPGKQAGGDANGHSRLHASSGANRVARAERPPAYPSPRPFPEPIGDSVPRENVATTVSATPPHVVPDRSSRGDVLTGRSAEESTMIPSATWQEQASVLQILGAVEYALEKWGHSGELYRFHCLVAVAGQHSHRRHFEAVDQDGGRAIARVVQQVRAWRDAESNAP